MLLPRKPRQVKFGELNHWCYHPSHPLSLNLFPPKWFMASTYTPKEQTLPAAQSVLTPDLYREIFAHSNEPIVIIDPQGHYLEQNRAHRDLLGYSDEELKGQTPAIHADPEIIQNHH